MGHTVEKDTSATVYFLELYFDNWLELGLHPAPGPPYALRWVSIMPNINNLSLAG